LRIAREALPFAAGSAVLAAAAYLLSPWAALPFLVFLGFTLFFFRDPERRSPPDVDALLSPADGRILEVSPARISIFLNVFNVHVCRTPIAGRVETVVATAGRFLAAFHNDASEQNERTAIVVSGNGPPVTFTLVAGLIARRIVCKVRAGQVLGAGERVGLIRFGSRVDVALPRGAVVAVRRGERVVAGESILARVSVSVPERELPSVLG
jgi:phosphatidylserine decarboxylase